MQLFMQPLLNVSTKNVLEQGACSLCFQPVLLAHSLPVTIVGTNVPEPTADAAASVKNEIERDSHRSTFGRESITYAFVRTTPYSINKNGNGAAQMVCFF